MKGSILQQVTGIGNYIFHAFLTSDNTGYSLPLSSNEHHQKVREQSKQTLFPNLNIQATMSTFNKFCNDASTSLIFLLWVRRSFKNVRPNKTAFK